MRLLLFCLPILLCACTSTHIVPQLRDGAGRLIGEQVILQQRDQVRARLQLHELAVRPAPLGTNVSSFWVEIENLRDVKLPVSPADFVLITDEGRQVASYDPDELLELTKPAVPYLVPYPYLGYYYLQDAERGFARNSQLSDASFYSSRRPEQIHQNALKAQAVYPSATLVGAIYFPVELRALQTFEIRYQVQALAGQKSFPLSYFFSVEKN
jgi:hypothetical protein